MVAPILSRQAHPLPGASGCKEETETPLFPCEFRQFLAGL